MIMNLPYRMERREAGGRGPQRTGVGARSAGWSKPLQNENGIALLMVLMVLSILMVTTVEFMHGTRINYTLAAHMRDETQAQALAQSALQFAILLFQIQGKLQGVGGASAGSAQIWKQVPISSSLFRMQAEGEAKEGDFLHFDGDFDAEITDESGKFNVNLFKSIGGGARESLARYLVSLMRGKGEYDYIFDKTSREEIVANIVDWVDADPTRANPYSGDENGVYLNLPESYRPRNDSMDSIAELALVRGVTDEFMRVFGPKLTTYGRLINVNSADKETLNAIIMRAAEQRRLDIGDAPVAFPTPEELDRFTTDFIKQRDLAPVSVQGFMEMLPRYFAINFKPTDFTDLVTDKSSIYTVAANGRVGDTVKTLRATLDVSGRDPKFFYWRVE